jgi:predicted GNAT superfamily acetyltransferase
VVEDEGRHDYVDAGREVIACDVCLDELDPVAESGEAMLGDFEEIGQDVDAGEVSVGEGS